jgi:hypothetical protein
MQMITTIGLDIAKSVFQVHGIGSAGEVVIRRQLKRRYVLAFFQKLSPCLIGIEACASSHYWSRELQALGHTVRTWGGTDDREDEHDGHEPDADEPSLGSTSTINQEAWASGDGCDREQGTTRRFEKVD